MDEFPSKSAIVDAKTPTLDDVAQLRSAVGWLIWAVFFPPLLANLTLFGIGFAGPRSILFVSTCIGVLGVIFRFVAILGVVVSAKGFSGMASLARLLILIGGVHVLIYPVIRVALLAEYNLRYWYFVTGPLDTLAAVIGLIFFRSLAQSLLADSMARRFVHFVVVIVAVDAASFVYPLSVPYTSPWFTWLLFSCLGLQAGVWLWGLLLLRRFRKMLWLVLLKRCANCAYPLQGLPEPRCPECGRQAVVV